MLFRLLPYLRALISNLVSPLADALRSTTIDPISCSESFSSNAPPVQSLGLHALLLHLHCCTSQDLAYLTGCYTMQLYPSQTPTDLPTPSAMIGGTAAMTNPSVPRCSQHATVMHTVGIWGKRTAFKPQRGPTCCANASVLDLPAQGNSNPSQSSL